MAAVGFSKEENLWYFTAISHIYIAKTGHSIKSKIFKDTGILQNAT